MKWVVFLLLPSLIFGGELRLTQSATSLVVPDSVTLSVSAISESPSAQEATRQNREVTGRIIEAIRALNLPKTTLSTEQFQLFPNVHEKGETTYRVINAIKISSFATEEVGTIIDVAVGAGASQVSNVSFMSSAANSARQEALTSAVAEAKKEAELLACAAGLHLTRIRSISLDDQNFPHPVAFAKSTSIIPADLTISAQVTLVFDVDD